VEGRVESVWRAMMMGLAVEGRPPLVRSQGRMILDRLHLGLLGPLHALMEGMWRVADDGVLPMYLVWYPGDCQRG